LKILITGAGGSPAINFTRSLKKLKDKYELIGADCSKYYLMRAETSKKYLVPPANNEDYIPFLNYIIDKEGIDFLHVQNDMEVSFVSENREKINTKTFLPDKETVKICQDKFESYKLWQNAGIKVPKTIFINNENDLKKAYEEIGDLWLRATSGAGGRGSIISKSLEHGKAWIDFHKGWGEFTAAEVLNPDTVTWMSLWKDGELVIAQGRKRLYWELSKLTPSGVTGITGTGVTCSDPILDEIAQKTVLAICKKPNGLFGVDLAYDKNGLPNPTEINIGRFFTTHQFFTECGINMPDIYVRTAHNEKGILEKEGINKKINPAKENMAWIRGVDFEPILTTLEEIESNVKKMEDNLKIIKEQ
jgi:carbamoyl-phosphate synthase large subunit